MHMLRVSMTGQVTTIGFTMWVWWQSQILAAAICSWNGLGNMRPEIESSADLVHRGHQVQACAALAPGCPQANEISFHGGISAK